MAFDVKALPEEFHKAVADIITERDELLGKVEDATDQLAVLTKTATDLEKAIADLKSVDDKSEDIKKEDLPEPVRKRFEELEAKAAEDEKLRKAQADQLAGMQKAALERDIDESLSKMDTAMPGEKAAAFRDIIKVLDESARTPVLAEIERLDKQLKEGELFKTKGVDGSGATGGDDEAVTAVLNYVADMRKADPELGEFAAKAAVLKAHPALVDRYNDAIRKRLN